MVAVFVGSLGGFIFGFDLGAVSAATQSLRDQFNLSPWTFGLTISASLWGTVAGAIFTGRFADRVDRRELIACCSFLYAVAAISIGMPFPLRWSFVLAMRFLCGVAIGGFTVGCPLYLSEIAPISMRGRAVSVFQVQVSVGVIVAFSVGAVCAHLGTSGSVWKWILGIGSLPAVALLLFVRFMPGIGGGPFASGRDNNTLTGQTLSDTHDRSSQKRLFVRRNARLILLATSVAVFNQLSGVNVLLLYMLEILASAGVDLSLGHSYTVLISGLSLATTLLGMAFVDRWGRKALLYLGSAGMAACLLTLGLTIPRHFYPLTYLSILVTYNAFFALSQGTVVWVYLSELFPPGLRGVGQGYGATVHWIANAILIAVFPTLQHTSSVSLFYIFALMMVLQIVVIWLWYPETAGTVLGSFAAAEVRQEN